MGFYDHILVDRSQIFFIDFRNLPLQSVGLAVTFDGTKIIDFKISGT